MKGEEREERAAEEADLSLWKTVKADFAGAPRSRVLVLALVVAWMAFQWGWGNDILLPPIVARAFEAVDDGSSLGSGIGAVVASLGAGGLFWGFTQTLDGVIVLSGLRLLPGLTARIARFLRKQGWARSYEELSFGTKFLIAYASGASVLCLVDVFATGQPGLATRKRMLAHAVALSVAGVCIAIAVVSTAAAIGTRVPATSDAAETVVRYASNPLTWLVIYGSLIAISALISRLTGKGADDDAAQEGVEPQAV